PWYRPTLFGYPSRAAHPGPHRARSKGTILGVFRGGDGEETARLGHWSFLSDREPRAAAGDLQPSRGTPRGFHGETPARNARAGPAVALYSDRLDGQAVPKCMCGTLSDAL